MLALAKDDGNDEDMTEMISYEVQSLSKQLSELEEKLKVYFYSLHLFTLGIVSYNFLLYCVTACESCLILTYEDYVRYVLIGKIFFSIYFVVGNMPFSLQSLLAVCLL